MADYDLTAGQTAPVHAGARHQFLIENKIDFSQNNVSSAETVDVFDVQANWFVHAVFAEVVTAEGGTATADVGDGDDGDGFLDDIDLNSQGGNVTELALTDGTPNTVTGYTAGKLYTAADTIEMLANNDLDGAVVVFRALVTNYNGVL